MSDHRLIEIRDWWTKEIWKSRYGLVADWKGADAKLLQGVMSNATLNFGIEATQKIGEALNEYVYDEDPFLVKTKHPFSLFAKNPMKWMAKPKQISRLADPPKPPEKFNYVRLTEEDLKARVAKCPEVIAKGFGHTLGLMKRSYFIKQHSPDFQKRLTKVISDTLGPDKARSLFLSCAPIVKELT